MAKENKSGVTAREAEILRRTRKQVGIVKAARKRCNEIVSAHASLKSPQFDGMPRGTHMPHGLDGSTEHAEHLLSILDREERRLKDCQKTARKIIRKLPEGLQGFCLYYYLEALSVLQASKLLDRSERTCWNYKHCIEHAGENKSE